MVNAPAQSSYSELLQAIQSITFQAQNYMERAVVAMYWKVGQHLHDYVVANGRLVRGRRSIYTELAKDLKINEKSLYEAVSFYRAYPQVDETLPLSWSHYRYLSRMKDEKERLSWQKRIVKENLNTNDLLILRRKSNIPKRRSNGKLIVKRGVLYHYRAVKVNDEYFMDCGFDNFIVPPKSQAPVNNARIYHSIKEDDYRLVLSKVVKSEIYTYKAKVEKVVDADTLLVMVDCGFGIFHKERLRLRGIDAAEKISIAGRAAAEAVERYLSQCEFIVIKTYKEDKYGRYLADVFYAPNNSSEQDVLENGVFLNQQLLDEGLVEVYK